MSCPGDNPCPEIKQETSLVLVTSWQMLRHLGCAIVDMQMSNVFSMFPKSVLTLTDNSHKNNVCLFVKEIAVNVSVFVRERMVCVFVCELHFLFLAFSRFFLYSLCFSAIFPSHIFCLSVILSYTYFPLYLSFKFSLLVTPFLSPLFFFSLFHSLSSFLSLFVLQLFVNSISFRLFLAVK